MRLLVSGASGFVGRNLLEALPKAWDVVATYHSDLRFPAFLGARGLDHIHPLRLDLASEEEARVALTDIRFDAAVNLAGSGDPGRAQSVPLEDLKMTVNSVINLARFCNADHLVHFSSGAVYDGHVGKVHPGLPLQPRFPYAISKLAAEHYLAALRRSLGDGPVTVVRFFGAYGPHEPPRKIFSRLVRAFVIEEVRRFTIKGDGQNLIDAMYVEDAVQGITTILQHPGRGVVVDFGLGEPMTIDTLVHRAAAAFGVEGVELVHSGEPAEYITFVCSPEPFAERFGFRPKIPLEVGLRQQAKWMMASVEREGP